MPGLRRQLACALDAVGPVRGVSTRSVNPDARALFVAPHPDDEVLGCGGTIAAKSASGAAIQVVILTDGRASHRGLIDEEVLADLRKAEALSAGRVLGVGAESYVFLDIPDHRLVDYRDSAVAQLSRLIRKFSPDEIYIPHHRDRLQDHVQTNLAVREALKGYGRKASVFEYPVWLWNTWPWTKGRHEGADLSALRATVVDIYCLVVSCGVRFDISNWLDLKLRALSRFETQVSRRGGDPAWPILGDVSSGEFLECFAGPIERYDAWTYDPQLTSD